MKVQLTAAVAAAQQQAEAMQVPSVRVTAMSPLGDEETATLGLAPLTIGNSAECDLVVRDPAVSRRHCEIALTPRGIAVRDLGSKNGTFLGEVRIVEVLLPAGTSIRIGTTRLSIAVAGPPVVVPLSRAESFGEAIGRAPIMRALFAALERAALVDEPVLLVGEPATGKTLLARSLHAAGPRRGGPFAVLGCRAAAPAHLDAALERAGGGTLLLDDVGALSPDAQTRLVRLLEARRAARSSQAGDRLENVRVVATSEHELKAPIAEGRLRRDLYHQLAMIELRVPPLRERKEDIPLLAERFLATQSPPRAVGDLPPHALELLDGHSWPENLRELKDVVARLSMTPEEVLTEISMETIYEDGPPALPRR